MLSSPCNAACPVTMSKALPRQQQHCFYAPEYADKQVDARQWELIDVLTVGSVHNYSAATVPQTA